MEMCQHRMGVDGGSCDGEFAGRVAVRGSFDADREDAAVGTDEVVAVEGVAVEEVVLVDEEVLAVAAGEVDGRD